MTSGQRHLDRTCYGCHQFYMTMAASDLSDVTPGTDWSMGCEKNIWDFDAFRDDVAAFRTCLDTAQTCEHWLDRARKT